MGETDSSEGWTPRPTHRLLLAPVALSITRTPRPPPTRPSPVVSCDSHQSSLVFYSPSALQSEQCPVARAPLITATHPNSQCPSTFAVGLINTSCPFDIKARPTKPEQMMVPFPRLSTHGRQGLSWAGKLIGPILPHRETSMRISALCADAVASCSCATRVLVFIISTAWIHP